MTQFTKDLLMSNKSIFLTSILLFILSNALLKSSKKMRIVLPLPSVLEYQQWNMLIRASIAE